MNNLLCDRCPGRRTSVCLLAVVVFASLSFRLNATVPSPGPNSTTNTALNTWSFNNTNSWASDAGYTPISYTNLNGSVLGNGTAVVIDSPNTAWLRYNVNESGGATNLTVSQGTVTFWFAPNWVDTKNGGTGPGQSGRLIEVGTYTTNNSYGWWSLWLDSKGTNVYFSAQTNGSSATYISVPVSWAITNRWHMLTLTYSSTNSSFYFDGTLLTNGYAVTIWPGTNVLTNGFCMGSDSTGIAQAHGTFDDLATYNYPLDATTISAIYQSQSFYYYLNPLNRANFSTGPYTPTGTPIFDVISGSGSLISVGTSSNCTSSSSIWLTNVSATLATNGTMSVTFTIQGGSSSVLYDVFANAILGPTNAPANKWAWMGQGYTCNTYSITNLPVFSAYLLLGTPVDSDGDGLTDAYELLVSHTDPHNAYSAGDGIPDGWKVLFGVSTTDLSVAGKDPDLDGLSNWQEYLWGTNPSHAEGLGIWIGSPGVNGLP